MVNRKCSRGETLLPLKEASAEAAQHPQAKERRTGALGKSPGPVSELPQISSDSLAVAEEVFLLRPGLHGVRLSFKTCTDCSMTLSRLCFSYLSKVWREKTASKLVK